jgi:hypothetical protein
LDKALEILNKPKTEMGTQTDIEWKEYNDLEIKIASLMEKELELKNLRYVHNKLAPYFQQLGLTKTWQYFNEICQDYFAAIELEEK